mgnify:CR=1 FL=1
MILRTLIVLAVTQGAPMPGEDVLGELVAQVMKLRADGQHAAAAQLAAAGAGRGDLAAADRVMLGGLAGEGFQASFAAGGAVADLCGLAAVMRLVAPLDVDAGGQQELATAIAAENKLAGVAGPEWRTVCEPTGATSGAADASAVHVGTARPTTPPANRAPAITDTIDANRLGDPRDRRRLRAGVGTIIPGLMLVAPLAGVLAYRAAGEDELRALRAGREGRSPTAQEEKQATDLQGRYQATTIGAAVLGATSAALVVSGVVLLATSRRQQTRVSVAPWGARGVGGLVLAGRF